MARKIWLFAVLMAFLVIPNIVSAQDGFGKNRVQYRKLDWKKYESPHFFIRYNGDLKDPKQYANMQRLVALLENHYYRYSSPQYFDFEIKEKLRVIIFETHSDLEGHPIGDPFLPEGVGAFVDWARVRMVLKQDFEPQLLERIVVHELAHQFQIKFMSKSFGGMLGLARIPNGFIEGGAEYLTGVVMPHTRDDIRDRSMRMMGSDIHFMPPWEALMSDQVNGYVAWKMVYDFLDAKFGPGTGIKFHVQGLKNHDLGSLLNQLSYGQLGNPNRNSELFNQEFFNYYNDLYELDRASRPKPYQDTDNFKGRNITPYNHPQPILSPVLSPDGKTIACFTIQKYGVALAIFPILEETLYSKDLNNLNNRTKDENKTGRTDGKKVVINLTPQMVPIPYEYLVNPFEGWPKNGTHITWVGNDKVAIFARNGRDHVLYVIEAKEGGKILQNFTLDVDQGFSPSASPDGKKVYFSAASHAIFDIYVLDLETGQIENLTNDLRYDTAPVVSPDGTQVVYVGNDEDFNHLFMLNLADRSKKQITFNRYNDIAPSWSDDGKKIVFTSDERERIWALYTLDLVANTRSLWVDPFGGVETPMFARSVDDKVYYIVYRNDDTFRGHVYPNYELFEAKLKRPVSTEPIVDNKESNIYSFDSNKFFDFELDPNQVVNSQEPPEDWIMTGRNISLGTSTYYGMFASSNMMLENLMKTKVHLMQFATYSSFFRVFNYTYINQENRLAKGYTFGYNRFPLYYRYYNVTGGRPKNFVLQNTFLREWQASAFAQYPRSKWTRVELFTTLKDTKFENGLTSEFIEANRDFFTEADSEVFKVMSAGNGPSLEAGVAVVRDTVVGSGAAQGPLHGNAFRAEFLAAPIGGKFNNYLTASAEARIYRKLGMGTLFALRGEAKTTTHESGTIIVSGGSDKFRGREWGSIIGNQLLYGSAEFRFPLVDGIVFPGGFGIGSFRGVLLADGGISKFNGQNFPAQKVATIGAGVQLGPFQMVWARHPDGKYKPRFYYSYGW